MKGRPRSCYETQPSRLRWASIRSIGGPVRVAARAGPFLTERAIVIHHANTRVGKAAASAVARRAKAEACPPSRAQCGRWTRRKDAVARPAVALTRPQPRVPEPRQNPDNTAA